MRRSSFRPPAADPRVLWLLTNPFSGARGHRHLADSSAVSRQQQEWRAGEEEERTAESHEQILAAGNTQDQSTLRIYPGWHVYLGKGWFIRVCMLLRLARGQNVCHTRALSDPPHPYGWFPLSSSTHNSDGLCTVSFLSRATLRTPSDAPWPGPLPTHTWVPLQRRVHGVADHRNSEGGTQCKGRRLNPPCRACTSNATIAVVIERARAHPHVHSLHLLVQRRCKHSRPAPGIVAGARAACVSSQCADEPAGEARG